MLNSQWIGQLSLPICSSALSEKEGVCNCLNVVRRKTGMRKLLWVSVFSPCTFKFTGTAAIALCFAVQQPNNQFAFWFTLTVGNPYCLASPILLIRGTLFLRCAMTAILCILFHCFLSNARPSQGASASRCDDLLQYCFIRENGFRSAVIQCNTWHQVHPCCPGMPSIWRSSYAFSCCSLSFPQKRCAFTTHPGAYCDATTKAVSFASIDLPMVCSALNPPYWGSLLASKHVCCVCPCHTLSAAEPSRTKPCLLL